MKHKILLVVITIIILIIAICVKKKPPQKYAMDTYVVQAGDTAWTIAKRNNPANKDIREIIYYMEQDNNIRAGYLQIGQEIKIRIYEMDRNKKSDASAGTLNASDK